MRSPTCLLILLLTVDAHAAVTVDPNLWSRIDAVNNGLAHLPPGDEPRLVALLEEAVSVMRSFDPEYQRIRADAFDTSFEQAEGLAKRAAPAFSLAFDGDTDSEAVSFATFAHLAPPTSPLAQWLAVYEQTHGFLMATGKAARCTLPMDVPAKGGKGKKGQGEALKKWAALAPKLPDGFLKGFARTAVGCLGGQT